MKKRLFKIIILVVLAILPNINSTGAYFFDEETLTGITITAGTWGTPPPIPPPTTSLGDVVINEVYWMGSGGEDEWVELRNTTSSAINLSGWKINLGSGGTEFILSGTVIGNGYYLITERAANLSAINDSIAPDQILAVVLPDAGRQLTLKNSSGGIIDQTPTGHWPAGSHTGGNRKSMERNSTPGNGTLDGSWHTCTDAHCNDTTYWDTEGNNYGTPKSANLSENDSTETNLNFYFGSDTSHVGFTVSGQDLSLFEKANYTITYDSDQTMQGIIGVLNVSGQSEVGAVNLFLGSCSEGGTCTANTGVKNINIEVKLTGPAEQILTSSLSI